MPTECAGRPILRLGIHTQFIGYRDDYFDERAEVWIEVMRSSWAPSAATLLAAVIDTILRVPRPVGVVTAG